MGRTMTPMAKTASTTQAEPSWRAAIDREKARANQGTYMAKMKATMHYAGSGFLPGGDTKDNFANAHLKNAIAFTDVYVGVCSDGRGLFAVTIDTSQVPDEMKTKRSDWLAGKDVLVCYVAESGKWERDSWAPGSVLGAIRSGLSRR